MTSSDHPQLGRASRLPVPPATPTLSIQPLTFPVPNRPVPLDLRLTVPVTGTGLPVILVSHGQGQSNHLSSHNGYAPIVQFWASHGFAVIQPTHLSSRSVSLAATTPGAPLFWKERAEDMHYILDNLAGIEEAAGPAAKGRLDASRVVVAGHSMGGNTASLLLGMRLTDPGNAKVVHDLRDERIKAGILFATPGTGGESLNKMTQEKYPFFRQVDFGSMETPALVVVGDEDVPAHLSTRGADWYRDPFELAPGRKELLTLTGGGHCLGGISGFDVRETVDESVERVSVVQRMTLAWLRSELGVESGAWSQAKEALREIPEAGNVERRN